MKKRLALVLTAALVLCLVLSTTAFAAAKTVVLKIGSPNMTVNGVNAEIDPGRGTKPVIINGRTLVPIRTIVREMGGTIAWDGALRQIVIAANNKIIRMHLNNAEAEVKTNSAAGFTKKKLEVAPTSINGRTMVPLRFVSEELGAKVNWNGTTKQITITFNAIPMSYSTYTGAWETNKGIIVFLHSGTSLTTGYNNYNIGQLSGSMSGSTFNGKWYVDAVDNGSVKITFSRDGKSFKGYYYIKQTNSSPGLGPAEVTQTYEISGVRS